MATRPRFESNTPSSNLGPREASVKLLNVDGRNPRLCCLEALTWPPTGAASPGRAIVAYLKTIELREQYVFASYDDRVLLRRPGDGRQEAVPGGRPPHPVQGGFRATLDRQPDLAQRLGSALTPEVSAFGDGLRVQLFEGGTLVYETASGVIWISRHGRRQPTSAPPAPQGRPSPTDETRWRMGDHPLPWVFHRDGGVEALTSREVELLGLLAEGPGNEGTAARLRIRPKEPTRSGCFGARVTRQTFLLHRRPTRLPRRTVPWTHTFGLGGSALALWHTLACTGLLMLLVHQPVPARTRARPRVAWGRARGWVRRAGAPAPSVR